MTISRRNLCKLGLLGTTSFGALPRLYAQNPAPQDDFYPWILQVFVSGGWDPTMVFDNKIGVASCAQEPGWRAAKSASGIDFVDHPERKSVKEFFDRYGGNASIVNGINSKAITYPEAIANMFGAVPDKRFRRCDWLSFYAALLNPTADMPHVIINAPYMPGEYAPSTIRLSSARITEILQTKSQPLGDDNESALLNFRNMMFQQIAATQNGASLDSEKLLTLYHQFLRNDRSIANIKKISQAIGPQKSQESDFLYHGKIAIELFQKKYSQCVSLQAGKEREWETPRDHFDTQSILYQNLFDDLNQIFAYAKAAGVLDRMIVMVISERGRSPMLNAKQGKSAWPFTSGLFWGVGIANAKVIQASDDSLLAKPINPVFDGNGNLIIEMRNIMAAIYLLCNAPAALLLPQVTPLSLLMASK